MIKLTHNKQKIKKLARIVASHEKVFINDHFIIEVKPARKGRVYGLGGDNKVSKFAYRLKITARPEFKKMVNDFIEQV